MFSQADFLVILLQKALLMMLVVHMRVLQVSFEGRLCHKQRTIFYSHRIETLV